MNPSPALVRFVLTLVGLGSFTSCVPGCSLFDQHAKEFDTLNSMAQEVRSQLGAGGMGQYAVAAQGINPGIRLHAAIVYEAGANYDGLAGQFTASAQGQFNRPVSNEDAELIRHVASAQYDSDTSRQLAIQSALKQILDRVAAPKPPASQPSK